MAYHGFKCHYCLTSSQASIAVTEKSVPWHYRLGHVNVQTLHKCPGYLNGIDVKSVDKLSFCEAYLAGKMHRKPFPTVGEIRSRRKLQLVHSDIWGPTKTKCLGGARYFVTFIDDYTRYCSVYFMKHKSEVFNKVKEYEALMTNESGKKVCTLRTDNSGEYKSE